MANQHRTELFHLYNAIRDQGLHLHDFKRGEITKMVELFQYTTTEPDWSGYPHEAARIAVEEIMEG